MTNLRIFPGLNLRVVTLKKEPYNDSNEEAAEGDDRLNNKKNISG